MLAEAKRQDLIALLASGHSRREAAKRVGCARSTTYRLKARDPQFIRQLAIAEEEGQGPESPAFYRQPKHWRAAAWILEWINPEDSGRGGLPPQGGFSLRAEAVRPREEDKPRPEGPVLQHSSTEWPTYVDSSGWKSFSGRCLEICNTPDLLTPKQERRAQKSKGTAYGGKGTTDRAFLLVDRRDAGTTTALQPRARGPPRGRYGQRPSTVPRAGE